MKITEIERFPASELIRRLRKVSMLEDENTVPYKHAFISLENICTDDLFPAQRYVWKDDLLKVRKLRWELERYDVNIFQLNGFVRIHLENHPESIDLLPPIIEESIERNGHITHIINDGMHRIYMAYLEWVIPQVVFIRGVSKRLPYYSYPIPDRNWGAIELRDDIPKGFIKKWHRIEANKKLYRNFNSAFKNVGGPRGNR